MPVTIDFLEYAKWSGILTLVSLVVAIIAFIFSWGVRFRFVGVTGFLAVVTVGLFALGLGLFSRTVVPGAVRFSLVYDNGANRAVVAVSPEVNESEVEATLEQAAMDLYSYGRSGLGENKLTIRLRTIIHPEPGVSIPLYLGQVKRSLASRQNAAQEIEIYSDKFAKLLQTEDTETAAN